MYRYTLGSFPLSWADAKRRLLADRRYRTSMMKSEPTNEELHAAALAEKPEDVLVEEVQTLLHLLIEAHKVIEDGPLREKIGGVLKEY